MDITQDLFIMAGTYIMVALIITGQDITGQAITMHLHTITGTTGFILITGIGNFKRMIKSLRKPGAFYLIMTGCIAGHLNNYIVKTFKFGYHVIKSFSICRVVF